ncbi:hypothetical protein CAEBREN_24961 [Caenorhabditis brenneri]|uniref:Reverse transcriptase domain-containing protein n=1 Tax=Caenorhabditis brenneri TaxID=135651 RepID=G0NCF7_CAEBE|nr:hypothetical protein CAEBREN_24961 [Caenorhabditis brenneri]
MATRWVTEHLKLKHDAVATPRIKPTKSLGNTTLEDLEKSAPSLGRPKKSTKPPITMMRQETPDKLEMRIQTRSVTKTLSTLKASVKKQEEEKKVADKQQSKSILGFFKSSESKGKGPRRSLAKCVSTDGAATNASDSVGQLLKTMTGAERVKASREMFARKSRTSLHGRPSLSAAILNMDEKDSKKEDEVPKEEVTPTKDDEESSTSVEIREGKGEEEERKKEDVIPMRKLVGRSTFEVIPQRKDEDEVPEEEVTPVKEEEADTTVTETVLSDDGSEDTHNRTYVIEEWEPVKRRFNTWCLDYETTDKAWLCDEVVYWYMQELCSNNDKYKVLDPCLWEVWKASAMTTESILQKMWSSQTYFFPLCEDEHWILLVINASQIWYANSTGGEPRGHVEKFMNELKRERAFFDSPYPFQKDNVNCGVHVCLMARSIATGEYWFDFPEVESFRTKFKQGLKDRNYELYSEEHVRKGKKTSMGEEGDEKKEEAKEEILEELESKSEETPGEDEVKPKDQSEKAIEVEVKRDQIPKLMDLKPDRIKSPVPRKLPNQANNQKNPKEKPTAQMGRKRKVLTGNPDKVVVKVREWFDKEFKSYIREGRSFQRLEWLTEMLTAAIHKASVGDEQTVDKMRKRCPPLDQKEGEMSTQTEIKKRYVKKEEVASQNRTGKLKRFSYWENRTKVFNSVIGQEFKQCEIPIDKIEEFFQKTTSVTNVPKKTLDEVTSRLPKLDIGEWIEEEFVSKDVQNALKKTKDTAPGVDGLQYHHLRWFDPDCKILTLIYNECRKHRKIPAHWKEAETILLYKGGEESKPDNWRPISLMPTIYKLYSSLWNRRIRSVDGVMSRCQRGFQEREGCNESIAILRSAIDVAKGKMSDLSVAWLDLTNAFGSVPHELIESTLIAYGYPETVVHIIKDMYDGASIRVKTRDEKSQQIRINSGVKQGDPISPTLFNMCLENVIRRHLEVANGHKCIGTRIKILAFADDMAILAETKGQLQKELTDMDQDCTPLNLIFKPSKCASLVIRKGVVQTTAEVKLKGVAIRNLNEKNSYKYLGVQTGAETRISEKDLMKKVLQELDKVQSSDDLTPPQKLDCIKCFVLPKMTYMYANSIPKLTELRVFANLVMRGVKVIHRIPVRGSPLEYVQLPVAKGGLGVSCPRITAMISFLVTILKKLWSTDEYIRNLYNEYLKAVVEVETGKKNVTMADIAYYLCDGKLANKKPLFGYTCFSRIRDISRGLSMNQDSPLHCFRFVEENGKLAIEVKATESGKVKRYTDIHLKKLQQLLKGDVNAALLHRFITEKPVKSEVVQVIQQHPGSNSFVRQGGKVSLACHNIIHKARLNLLNCHYNTYDKNSPKTCRRCGAENETQWHILQVCPYSWGRWITHRHDAVLYRVKELIESGSKKDWKLRIDHEFPQFARLRPDIFMESPDKKEVIIGDVACPYEHGLKGMERSWQKKVEKYDEGFQMLREQGKKVTVLPIIIGSLGTWWTPTSKSLEDLGISKTTIRKSIPILCSTVMEHSTQIYWRHIHGEHYISRPIRYGYEKPTGQWRRNDNVLSTTD